MNPFVHNAVAIPAGNAARIAADVAAADVGAARDALPGGRAPRHWRRRFGMLALAAGMALAAAPAVALDVNRATAEQLQTLRGVGPKTAAVIVNERQRGGRFLSLEDLSDRVRGIGAKKARALEAAGLTVGPGDGPAAQPGPAGSGPAKTDARPGRQGARRGASRP